MRYVAICQSFLVEIVFCPRLGDASIHRTSHCTIDVVLWKGIQSHESTLINNPICMYYTLGQFGVVWPSLNNASVWYCSRKKREEESFSICDRDYLTDKIEIFGHLHICYDCTRGASSSFRLLTLFFAHFLEGFRTILVISSSVFFQKTLHATSINILFLWFYSLKGKLNISCPLFGEFCPLWWCGCSFSKAQQDGMLGKKLMRKKLCLVCLCNSQAMFPHLKLL